MLEQDGCGSVERITVGSRVTRVAVSKMNILECIEVSCS